MGYPMSYDRFINRNGLTGDYGSKGYEERDRNSNMLSGDLRRLESDNLDEWHLNCYAEACGVSVDQARAILEMFFSGKVFSYKSAPNTIDRRNRQLITKS